MVASVAHEVGVHDVVLDDAAADDDGARVPRLHGERIDVADVLVCHKRPLPETGLGCSVSGWELYMHIYL